MRKNPRKMTPDFDQLIDFLGEEGVLFPGGAHWPILPTTVGEPDEEDGDHGEMESKLLNSEKPDAEDELKEELNRVLESLTLDGGETDTTSEVDWSGLFPEKGIFQDKENRDDRDYDRELVDAGQIFEDPDWRRLKGDDPWDNVVSEDELNDFFEDIENGEIDPREVELGFDTCAWYSQIHFNLYDWGIFIKSSCLDSIGKSIARCLPGPYRKNIKSSSSRVRNIVRKQCIRAAFSYLYLHEIYHHMVESIGIRFLVTRGRDSYVRYMDNLYYKLIGDDDQLEEALATAHSILKLNTRPYNKNILPAVMRANITRIVKALPSQPPGYRKAEDYLNYKKDKIDKEKFKLSEHELQSRIQEGTIRHCLKRKSTGKPSRWEFGRDMMRGFYRLNNHIYEIVTPSSPRVLPPKGVTPFVVCSTTEAANACFSKGWEKVKKGGKGSHVKMDKPGARPIIIPGNRKELSSGVVKNIMGSLQVNESQFKEMIGRKGKG